MKTLLLSLTASLLLASCGQPTSSTPKKPGKVKTIVQETLTTTQVCKRFPTLSDLSTMFKADHDIKLYQRTIDRVLEEIDEKRPNGQRYRASKFWSTITPETRNVLNHEVMIQARKQTGLNEKDLLAAVAIYFSSIRKNFSPTDEYVIRTKGAQLYAFTVRGGKQDHMTVLGMGCMESGSDLAFVNLPEELFYSHEVTQEIECRGARDQVILTLVRDSVMIFANKKLYTYPSVILKDVTKGKVRTISLSNSFMSLSIVQKTNQTTRADGMDGVSSTITMTALDQSIRTAGACR